MEVNALPQVATVIHVCVHHVSKEADAKLILTLAQITLASTEVLVATTLSFQMISGANVLEA